MALGYTWGGRPVASLGAQLPKPKPPQAPKPGQVIQGGPHIPFSWGQHGPFTWGSKPATPAPGVYGPGQPPAPVGHPQAPQAPQAPQTPLQQPPLDAQYYQNVAQNQFNTNNTANALGLQDSQSLTALQNALGQIAYAQPRAQLATEQAANRRGALYSTVEGQQQGDLATRYGTQANAATTSYQNSHQSIAARLAALQGGEQLYEQGQALASMQRAAAAAAKDQSLGQKVPKGTGNVSGGQSGGIGSRKLPAKPTSYAKGTARVYGRTVPFGWNIPATKATKGLTIKPSKKGNGSGGAGLPAKPPKGTGYVSGRG